MGPLPHDIQYRLYLYSELPTSWKFQMADYIAEEFGGSEFAGKYEMADPDFSIVACYQDKLIGFGHMLVRQGKINGRKSLIGGLMSLVVDKKFRGQGLGRELMLKKQRHLFEQHSVDLVVGFPFADGLFDYFLSMGIGNKILGFTSVSNGKEVAGKVRAIAVTNPKKMNLELSEIQTVDLGGKPW